MRGVTTKNDGYGAVDIVKLLLALLIVSAHYISENAAGRIHPVSDYASSIYVIVVPFFFACSGFFLFRKMKDGNFSKIILWTYCKKLLIMYFGWSLVYVCFTMLTWMKYGTSRTDVLHYFLTCVTYSTYKTIWFLPATVVGAVLVFFFAQKVGARWTAFLGCIFYILGCLGASYSFRIEGSKILECYNYIFFTTRNGIFNGFPFVLIGYMISMKDENSYSENVIRNLVLTCIFGMFFIAEALVIKKLGAVNVNTLIMLLPFTYFFLLWCLGIRMKTTRVTIWFRKMSTDIFLCQRIYLSALPELFQKSLFEQLLRGNPYIGWFTMLALSIATSAVLIKITERHSWLANFC